LPPPATFATRGEGRDDADADAVADVVSWPPFTRGAEIHEARVAVNAIAKPSPPALSLSVEGACAALGVSWELWREHVEPEVRIVRVGRRKLVPVRELERWLDEHAEKAVEL
jgi:hypothetical protein